jgi:galactose mutarotase-like enzyme
VLHELSNEHLSVKISAKGAEMHSVFLKKLDKEILWQADEQVWPRHAPVLFPIVGKLKDDAYTYKGKSYSLSQHGFARDCGFTVIEKSNAHMVFELKEDETSLQKFPFRFVLHITYRIELNCVSCHYSVLNPAEEDLYFSIGAHPGFVCPLFEGEQFEDYYIQCEDEEDEKTERRLLRDGLLSGQTEPVFDQGILSLKKELFDKDAIVLNHLQSAFINLSSTRYMLHFDWYNMPYFGIWTKKGCDRFICLEPWAGIADTINASGHFEEKEGIIRLGSHQQYDCGFSFSPFRLPEK